MDAQWPAQLRSDRHCLIVLNRVLQAAQPQEGCALLLGCRHQLGWRLERIWPCCNRWQPEAERSHRFLVDPREQLLAQRWCREHSLLVIGSAHSHPDSPAIASSTDQTLCVPPALVLIRSGLTDWQAPPPEGFGAWWIRESAAAEPLELVLEEAGAERHLGE